MRTRPARSLVVAALALVVVASGCSGAVPADRGSAAAPPRATPGGTDQVAAAFGKLPLRFEVNRGQLGDGVDFLARGRGYSVSVGATEVALWPSDADGSVRMRLVGADAAAHSSGVGRPVGISNYLTGERSAWVTGVPSYASVRYADTWPGIDVVYKGAPSGLEYDFVVAPGADPARVALEFDHQAELAENGDLVIATPAGPVRHREPFVYQQDGGRRTPVTAAYRIGADGRVGFELGRYDPARPLVIDPVVVYSTFLGAPLGEAVNGIAVDSAGQAFVAGSTTSSDFPVIAGALQGAKGAGATDDAFVAKFNPTGNGLVFSTFLGGSGADVATAIAIDAAGNTYVTGTTTSTNFPTANALQAAKGAGTTTDAFVAKLNTAGSALVYSTYLGGGGVDAGRGIKVGPAGDAYVAGSTESTDFPTANAVQATRAPGLCPTATVATNPCSDAFVARLNPAGSALVFSTYLGGAGPDVANGIALDAAGDAYLAGSTGSNNFPTATPFQAAIGGGTCPVANIPAALCTDAFVTKVLASGAALAWSTYLGGGAADSASAIALDAAGNPYVTGAAASTNFPTAAAFQGTKGGGPEPDAFVTKMATSGASLVYSTFLGGLEQDQGSAIAVDATGSAHVSGIANSELFPVERPVARLGGNQEAFVARLNPAGNGLIYSSHYGGIGSEDARAIATDGSGSTYIGGLTSFARVPEYFPTVNAFQSTFGGGFVPGTPNSGDGFVAKIVPDTPGRPLVTRLTPRGGPVEGGTSVIVEGVGLSGASVVRFGDTPARSFVVESDRRVVAVSPNLPEGIHKVTVTTGGGTSPTNPVAEFWAGEGSWSLTGSLNTPRSAHTTTLLPNGQVLVAGGRVSTGGGLPLGSAELYDPRTGTWRTTGSLADARWSHTATLLRDGRVLVAGGYSTTTNLLDSAEIYDPATGTWSAAASMANRRGTYARALVTGPNCGNHCGKVLVIGGRGPTSTQTLTASELYDPVRNVWEPTGPLNEGRYLTEAAPLPDGRVLVAGGFGPTDTAETWDPRTGTWSFTATPMSFSKARPTVTPLRDGNVLVNNGWNNGPVPASDVFDWRTNSFRRTETPKTHRWNATAVLLPNGRVLALAGGVGGATADVYDPRTNSFRSAGSLQIARGAGSQTAAGPGGTAVVLSSSTEDFEADERVCGQNCGKVLVVGNTDDPITELYRPAQLPSGGYWLTASDGGVFAFGQADFFGSTGNIRLNRPVVGMAATPSGRGYWLVASDGGVFAFGDAQFYGSTGAIRLNQPVVGIARTPSGRGYWLVASDGGIFAFGDAQFYGSTGAIRLNQPVVGMAATPSGRGYWLVASDGGVFAFGDAAFRGSTGAIRLNRPMVGMAPTLSGRGYWLTASDGGVFAFGDAVFRGSTGAIRLNSPVVGMAATPSPFVAGYWLVAADGGVFAFGDARFAGSTGNIRLNRPMVGMAALPRMP